MPIGSTPYSSEQIAEAITRHRAGESVAHIAQVIGCSRPTVYNWIRQASEMDDLEDHMAALYVLPAPPIDVRAAESVTPVADAIADMDADSTNGAGALPVVATDYESYLPPTTIRTYADKAKWLADQQLAIAVEASARVRHTIATGKDARHLKTYAEVAAHAIRHAQLLSGNVTDRTETVDRTQLVTGLLDELRERKARIDKRRDTSAGDNPTGESVTA